MTVGPDASSPESGKAMPCSLPDTLPPRIHMIDTWRQTTIWALAVSAIAAAMHSADELWSRWDYGAQVGDATIVSLTSGALTGIALLALGGVLTRHRWGSALAVAFGLFALYSGGTHLVNTDGMNALRWVVVAAQIGGALVLVVTASRDAFRARTTKPMRPVGG